MHNCPRLALFMLLFATACTSINPVTGRREVLLMSREAELKIDSEAARQVEAELGLMRNDAIEAYVARIGDSLAMHSPRTLNYSFQIVEGDAPNAFALPGGHIYVSRGLLLAANSEAELAHVLGHEIGHVAARHAAQRRAHIQTLGLATLLTELLSGAPELAESETVSGHFVARYARTQEREADQIGQDLAVKAGVDPRGLATFMQTLENLSKLDQGFASDQNYFATHPAVGERRLAALGRAEAHAWRTAGSLRDDWESGVPVGTTRNEFLTHLEGMSVERNASEGVFVDSLFLHPELEFSMRFPHEWTTVNTPAQVFALSPTRDAVVALQLDRDGNDPRRAALAFSEREDFDLLRGASLRVGGLPAYRGSAVVDTRFGNIDAEITWIAYRGHVFRILSGMLAGSQRPPRGLFRKASHSFRPLTPKARAQITELRLRIAEARPGETLQRLSDRVSNEWTTAYTAVLNALPMDGTLAPHTRVKVAIRQPYPARDLQTESSATTR